MSATHLDPGDLIHIPGGGFLIDGRDEERLALQVIVAPWADRAAGPG